MDGMPMPDPATAAPAGAPQDVTSPATSPVPNRGLEAAGLARLSMIVRMLEEALPMLGSTSEIGQSVLKSISSLSKSIPPGSLSAGVEDTAMQKVMMAHRQQAPLIAALRASMARQNQPPQDQSPQAAPAAAAA